MARREKKNLLPLIVLTVIFWGMLGAMIVLVDPLVIRDFPIVSAYFGFFLTLFLAVFFMVTLIMNNTRRGLLVSVGVTVFFVLRLIRLGNVVNAVLLFSLLGVIDFYFSNR